MAQPNPDDMTRFDQALRLVEELAPDDQAQLVAELERNGLSKSSRKAKMIWQTGEVLRVRNLSLDSVKAEEDEAC